MGWLAPRSGARISDTYGRARTFDSAPSHLPPLFSCAKDGLELQPARAGGLRRTGHGAAELCALWKVPYWAIHTCCACLASVDRRRASAIQGAPVSQSVRGVTENGAQGWYWWRVCIVSVCLISGDAYSCLQELASMSCRRVDPRCFLCLKSRFPRRSPFR